MISIKFLVDAFLLRSLVTIFSGTQQITPRVYHGAVPQLFVVFILLLLPWTDDFSAYILLAVTLSMQPIKYLWVVLAWLYFLFAAVRVDLSIVQLFCDLLEFLCSQVECLSFGSLLIPLHYSPIGLHRLLEGCAEIGIGYSAQLLLGIAGFYCRMLHRRNRVPCCCCIPLEILHYKFLEFLWHVLSFADVLNLWFVVLQTNLNVQIVRCW